MNTTKSNEKAETYTAEDVGCYVDGAPRDDGSDSSMYAPNYTPCPQCHVLKAHFESRKNPIKGAFFESFEIQTCAEFTSPDGENRFVEPIRDEKDMEFAITEASSPVMFAIYGRLATGTAEHICDRKSLQDARETLRNIIGA